jgi:DNA-binding transcriptional MerR regulator
VFRAQEVCEIAEVQPYVLRGWEAEFPELGVSKSPGGPRVYRRADVALVLRLKQLVFEEGLTLAGVRRQLREEQPERPMGAGPSADDEGDAELSAAAVAQVLGREARRRILDVRDGLAWILSLLGAPAAARTSRTVARASSKRPRGAARPAKAAKKVRSRVLARAPRRARPTKTTKKKSSRSVRKQKKR